MQFLRPLLVLCLSLLPALPASAALRVFACEPEWAALAETIGGAHVQVFSATHGRQDPHHIEARPSLIARARRADLLFCSGAELEQGWLPLLLRKAANPAILPGQPGHLMATEQVELLGKPDTLDRRHGDVHAAGNPHIHLNPHNILKVADVLARRLAQLDETNGEVYEKSLDDFTRRWQMAIKNWETRAADLRGGRFAVNHNSWLYLAQWLQLDVSLVLEPYPGVPPSADHLARLTEQIGRQPVKKIIYSAHANPRAALWLAQKTGIPAVQLPYTVGGSDRVDDLYQLFDDTLRLLGE